MKPKFKAIPSCVEAAFEIVDMYHELQALRAEVEELREYERKYRELLDSSISHGNHMMRSMLELTLKPGVMDAIAQANGSTTVMEDPE